MAEGTYRVKVKQEVWIRVTAESGADAKRRVEALALRFASPFDERLAEGDYTSWAGKLIIQPKQRLCNKCNRYQHSLVEGNCSDCPSKGGEE